MGSEQPYRLDTGSRNPSNLRLGILSVRWRSGHQFVARARISTDKALLSFSVMADSKTRRETCKQESSKRAPCPRDRILAAALFKSGYVTAGNLATSPLNTLVGRIPARWKSQHETIFKGHFGAFLKNRRRSPASAFAAGSLGCG